MEIKISCPSCAQHIAIDEAWRGRSMQCPACNFNFRVPESAKPKSKITFNTTAIVWSIIGLLILTNALEVFFWRRAAQRLPSPVRKIALRSAASTNAAPSASNSSPSSAADVPIRDAHNAVVKDNLPLLKQLLDVHPEILNQRMFAARNTLLISAASWGTTNTLEELLKRNADVNARSASGQTALFACVISTHGTKEIAAMLLDHGANFTITDNKGETPLQRAVEKNRQDMIDLLKQHGAKE
jgi:hypothetical protein